MITTPRQLLPPRLPDWPERLAAYIEARRHQPFAWGANDCASFAAGAVQALTGQTPTGPLGSPWASAKAAAELLQTVGGLHAACCNLLGPPVPAIAAQRGDVVCVPIEGRHTCGVWLGNGTWCAPGEAGLEFRPAAECTFAWRV